MSDLKITVFYVWVPLLEFDKYTQAFVESYNTYRPGVKHDLVVITKTTRAVLEAENEWLDLPDAKYLPMGPHGYDIGPFRALAPEFADQDRLVLLGSYSRLLCDDWLKMLTDAGPLAAATASYELNPHLRTNCLSVRPDLVMAVPSKPMSLANPSKRDCYDFEHGPDSLYKVAQRQGVYGVMVGRFGVYKEAEWPSSGVYRQGEQEGLICADNHTDMYQNGTPNERPALQVGTWARRQIIKQQPITVLTVTIPGREDILARNLRSVNEQTVPVMRQFICSHIPAARNPQVHYSQAKNDLLESVDTEFVAVLNDDDLWLPHHIETLAPYIHDSDVVYSWETGNTRHREDCNNYSQKQIIERFENHPIIDGSCIFRTDLLRAVGGFPTDWEGPGPREGGHYKNSKANFEDWRLFQALSKAGARFTCVPSVTWTYSTDTPGRLSAVL